MIRDITSALLEQVQPAVEALLAAAAREFVQTRPVFIFWGKAMFLAATSVAYNNGKRCVL